MSQVLDEHKRTQPQRDEAFRLRIEADEQLNRALEGIGWTRIHRHLFWMKGKCYLQHTIIKELELPEDVAKVLEADYA